MLKITNKTIIYVLSVAQKATGGTELLHQLVNEINNNGGVAKIVYVDKLRVKEKTPETFKKYINKNSIAETVEDISDNILIIPEILLSKFSKYKYIQKCVWWLSVDNYFFVNGLMNHIKHKGFLKAMKHILIDRKTYPKITVSSLNAYHFYQSEYAHEFLKNNGVEEKNMFYLSDYLNDEFIEDTSNIISKENIVLYNPAKGLEFTKKIIENFNDVTFFPLCNMTPKEVHDKLLSSKVYIDFGNHPGKDRFPREAVISGCCVITGKRGAANNDIDIPIDSKYKFDENDTSVAKIRNQILYCINNYDQAVKDFKKYKEIIKNEKKIFSKHVKNYFIKKS